MKSLSKVVTSTEACESSDVAGEAGVAMVGSVVTGGGDLRAQEL